MHERSIIDNRQNDSSSVQVLCHVLFSRIDCKNFPRSQHGQKMYIQHRVYWRSEVHIVRMLIWCHQTRPTDIVTNICQLAHLISVVILRFVNHGNSCCFVHTNDVAITQRLNNLRLHIHFN
mmetsp:Transcript_2709/g.6414  ORF Transcript_2709/g.6414 Transcript_2709/m.6414 type:complete len:121 (+) Transcript_2709:117-479(+)